jgi:hypothetical protein
MWQTSPSSGKILGCSRYLLDEMADGKFAQYNKGGIKGNLSVNYSLNLNILF